MNAGLDTRSAAAALGGSLESRSPPSPPQSAASAAARSQSADRIPMLQPLIASAARFSISSGGTSSTWVATLQRCPNGSSN